MDTHVQGDVVTDDGEYYTELDGHQPGTSAQGFLRRRCNVGVTSPDGFESVGRLAHNPDGQWAVSIEARADGFGCGVLRSVGTFAGCMNAIVALWGERHSAYCRHKD